MIGLFVAIPLSLFAFGGERAAAAICAIAVLSLAVAWPFKRDDAIYRIHDTILRLTDSHPPRFLIAYGDPLWRTEGTIVSTFSDPAFRFLSYTFPKPGGIPWVHDRVFFLSSTESNPATVERALAANVDSVTPLASVHFDTLEGTLWVYEFDAVNSIVLPQALKQFQARRPDIPGAALPSLVGRADGNARVAIAGQTPKGFLTCGPYARLAPGIYDIRLQYSARGAGNSWDVAIADATGPLHILRSGTLADTGGADQELDIKLTFPRMVDGFQIRTVYGGGSMLKVSAVGIKLDRTP
jgi:hypothetical protein